jgi:hypothetical protein
MGFELAIPSLVFGMANEAAAARRYEVRVCGHRRRAAATADWGGVEFRTSYGSTRWPMRISSSCPGCMRS